MQTREIPYCDVLGIEMRKSTPSGQEFGRSGGTRECSWAVCLKHGIGIGCDLVRVVQLYRLSPGKGHVLGQLNIAACFGHGIGVCRDLKRAADF
jgi:hypothetical protein